MKLLALIIALLWCFFAFFYTISIDYVYCDYYIYREAISLYFANMNYYKGDYISDGFVYFPSFFLLSFLIVNLYVYLIFSLMCVMCSTILIQKLYKDKTISLTFVILESVLLLFGNIDVLISLIFLICVYYRKKKDNDLLIAVLLAFISFKPSVIIIIIYFFFSSKNKLYFAFLYALSFICFNIIMETNISYYLLFIFGSDPSISIRILSKTWFLLLLYHIYEQRNNGFSKKRYTRAIIAPNKVIVIK